LRGKSLEGAIWSDVSALLAEPKRIADEYERRLNLGNDPKEAPSPRKLSMQTSRVQRQISKLIDAYSEGLIEKREFEPRIRDARAYLEKLKLEMRSQEQLQTQLSEMRNVIGQLKAFAEQVRDRLDTADWTLQRQLISILVKRIEIGAEEVRIIYRVDCGPFELAPFGGHVQDCWRRRGATRAPAGAETGARAECRSSARLPFPSGSMEAGGSAPMRKTFAAGAPAGCSRLDGLAERRGFQLTPRPTNSGRRPHH
jgi:site-specific DNA recombinase